MFGHEGWCGARDYPTLKKPIACMGLDYFTMRDRVEQRYPFYKSSAAERARLFGRSSNPDAPKSSVVSWLAAPRLAEAPAAEPMPDHGELGLHSAR